MKIFVHAHTIVKGHGFSLWRLLVENKINISFNIIKSAGYGFKPAFFNKRAVFFVTADQLLKYHFVAAAADAFPRPPELFVFGAGTEFLQLVAIKQQCLLLGDFPAVYYRFFQSGNSIAQKLCFVHIKSVFPVKRQQFIMFFV